MCLSYLLYVIYFFLNGHICRRFGLAPPEDAENEATSEPPKASDADGKADVPQPREPVPNEFLVTLGACEDRLVGVKLDAKHPDALLISHISPNTTDLIPAWNAMHSGAQSEIYQGDHIVAVNGVRGKSTDMKQAIKDAKSLELTIARGSTPPSVVIGKVDVEKDSEASTQATATDPAPPEGQQNVTQQPCKAALAMLAIAESSGSLRGVLSGTKEGKDGSLKDVLPAKAGDVETAGGGSPPEEKNDEDEPRQCPADPSNWLIDRTMQPLQRCTSVAFAVVIFWVALFTYVMVDGAGRLGCVVGMPHVIMGYTILAAGTSVPDMIASISVARDDEADMAAANAVGSNTFDILLGLGAPWLIGALMGREILVPAAQLQENIAILAACLAAYVTALCLSGFRLTRRLGAAMVLVYVGAIAFTLVRP